LCCAPFRSYCLGKRARPRTKKWYIHKAEGNIHGGGGGGVCVWGGGAGGGGRGEGGGRREEGGGRSGEARLPSAEERLLVSAGIASARGAPKKNKIESDVYLADDKWGRLVLFFFNFCDFFYGVFVRFSTRGVQKHHKKLFGESTCQKLLAEKGEIFFFSLSSLPSAFVRFSTRGVQKHHKTLLGGNTCQKLLAEKVEEKKLFSFRLFPSIVFYRVFGRFSA
jgi:hypothetical protein